MKRRQLLTLAGAAAGSLAVPRIARAAWPERPITIICPWAAGGGTDAVARMIGTLLERELRQPVNVVNRTGGSGVVGHQAIAQARPDGYTLGIITVEINMMHWQGLTELTFRNYTPFALMNADPAGVNVKTDSPHQSVRAILDFARANPGRLKASGTGQGGIWHLAIAGLLRDQGIAPDAIAWVPSNGAAPGLQDMVAGGIDVCPCSIPEARALIDAGRVKALAIMAPERDPSLRDVPTLKEAINSNWTMAAWRGMAGPQGLPADVTQTLVAAMDKIYRSQEYTGFMTQRGFGMVYRPPAGFTTFMNESNEALGATMRAVGIARG